MKKLILCAVVLTISSLAAVAWILDLGVYVGSSVDERFFLRDDDRISGLMYLKSCEFMAVSGTRFFKSLQAAGSHEEAVEMPCPMFQRAA
jgi:hypothetical protein